MTIPSKAFKDSQTLIAGPTKTGTGVSRAAAILKEFLRDPRWWFVLILLLCVIAALGAQWISPYDPLAYHPLLAEQGPTRAHLLGTDSLGRDQLSRVIYGTRISLTVGIISILLGGLGGSLLGILAAYFKGWVDQVVAIVVDALLSFPSLVLALAVIAALGPSLINVVIAIAVVRVPIYARLARGQTLQVTSQDYVHAAHSLGTSSGKIILRHILPNILAPLLVQATTSVSLAILDESVLSFLGLGAQPPTPEWGAMITDAQTFLSIDPWMIVGPSLAIILVVLSFNLVGDALRDRLDPRDAARSGAVTR